MEVRKLRVNDRSEYLKPGINGTLGDTMPQVNLRTSAPDLPLRPKYTKSELREMGSNLSKGHVPNPYSHGYAGVVVDDGPYTSEIKPKIQSYIFEGRDPMCKGSFTLARKKDSWLSKVLNIEHTSRRDPGFYPLPGGYPKSGVSRGPEPTRIMMGDEYYGGRPPPFQRQMSNNSYGGHASYQGLIPGGDAGYGAPIVQRPPISSQQPTCGLDYKPNMATLNPTYTGMS